MVSISVFVIVGMGCSSRDPALPPAPPEAPQTQAMTPIAAPVLPAPPIPEQEVRAFVEIWLSAQNRGDFGPYSELYAQRLEAVKRSGSRTRRYDRAGWLADRQNMFRRPMQVSVADVRVVTNPSSAIVSFEQTWSAATYRDVGPKQLVIVRQDGKLRIAREEMLQSLIASDGDTGAPGPAQFMFVIDVEGPSVVVHVDAEEGWATGPLHLASRDPYVVARTAAARLLPDDVKDWSGRRVQTYSARGPSCVGTIGAMREVRRVFPHFGNVAYWNGEDGAPRATVAQIAQDAWAMARTTLLVGRLEQVEGSCDGALWARPTDAQPPLLLQRSEMVLPPDRPLSELRRLRAYRDLQAEYVGNGRVGSWHEGVMPVASRWSDSANRTTTVTIVLTAGGDCGEWGGRTWAAFDVTRWERASVDIVGERWNLRSDPSAMVDVSPTAAFDLNADGRVEYLVEDGLYRFSGDAYEQVLDITPDNLDCGC